MSDTAFPSGADLVGIGARILGLRTERGITQTELAGTEFTRAYVSSIEGGKRTPSPRAAGYFAGRLGTDVQDLCFGYAPQRRRSLLAEAAQARVDLSGGHLELAQASYEALLAEAKSHQDGILVAMASCGLGLVARHRGDAVTGGVLFDEADVLLANEPLIDRLPAILGRLWARFAGGAIDEALAIVEEHLRSPDLADPTARFALLAATGLPLVERGDIGRAGSAIDSALRLAPAVNSPEVLARGYYHVTRVLIAQGRYEEAEQTIVRATTLYEHLQLRTEVGMCRFAHGYLMARRGNLLDAEMHLRQARVVLGETGAVPRFVNASAELAEVLRKSGRGAEAADLVAECRALTPEDRAPEQLAELDRIEARIVAERGDTESAETLFRSAIDRYVLVGATLESVATYRLYGDQLMRWGRTADAAAVYRRGLEALEHS